MEAPASVALILNWQRRVASALPGRINLFLAGVLALGIAGWPSPSRAQSAMTLDSVDLVDGGTVPPLLLNDRQCGGANHSPQLSWHGAPPATRSFALTVFDADAPGRGWWHWAVALIPRDVDHLVNNASGLGAIKRLGAIEARNDWGDTGYGGPCPPSGKPHRYIITLYALNTDDLSVSDGRPAIMFDHEIRVSALASAKMIVTYGR